MKKTIKVQLKTSRTNENPFFNKALWHNKREFPHIFPWFFFLPIASSKCTTLLSRIPVKVLSVPIDRPPSNNYPGISAIGNRQSYCTCLSNIGTTINSTEKVQRTPKSLIS
jgi:hypothetical protein